MIIGLDSRRFCYGMLCLAMLAATPAATFGDDAIPEWQRMGLKAALDEPNDRTLETALGIFPSEIWRAGDGDVADRLGAALSDDDSDVQLAAVEALGQLGEAAAGQAELLVEVALGDGDRDVREAAAWAFSQLDEAGAGQAERLGAALSDDDSNVQLAAANLLGQLGEAAAGQVERLGAALSETEWQVRQAAAQVLSGLGEAAAGQADRLGAALTDTEWPVRQAAARALGGLGEAAAGQSDHLGAALTDTDAGLRQAAARALGGLGEAAAGQAERLGEALSDDDSDVQLAAIEALGHLGEAAAGQAARLVEVSLNIKEDNDVRQAATQALLGVGPVELSETLATLDHAVGSRTVALEFRLWARLLEGGQRPRTITLIDWLGRPSLRPVVGLDTDRNRSTSILDAFNSAWPKTEGLRDIRQELADQAVYVAENGNWLEEDVRLLAGAQTHLRENGFGAEAAAVERVIDGLTPNTVARWTMIAIVGHATLWLLLIFAYPRLPQVQAFFF